MKKVSFPLLSEQLRSRMTDNGVRIYVLPRRETASVTMQAWVKTGSIHEGKYLGCGLSHFLEHMVFHGTKEYPGSAISDRVAAYGGNLNAATSAEFTCFYFNLPSDRWREGLAMLDSLIREPLLPEDKFHSECAVIRRELAMYKDSPLHNLTEALRQTAFRSHPVRFPVAGYADKLSEVTVKILRAYHTLRYTPERTFYVVAGDADPDEVFAILRQRTSSWPRGRLDEPPLPGELPCRFPRLLRIEFPAPQAYCAVGWQSPGTAMPDYCAADAFTNILGNGSSSRLYEELVNKKHLALGLLFNADALSSLGYSDFVAVAEPGKLDLLTANMFGILQKFIESGPADEELERVRTREKADFLRALQTNHNTARLVGRSVIRFGSPEAADRYLSELEALTAADVMRAGRQYFAAEAATVVKQFPYPASGRGGAVVKTKHPDPELTALPGGQRVLILENRALPLVSVSVLLSGGVLNEEPDQAGLTSLLARTLPCGCAQFDESTFNRLLDLHAIELSVDSGNSSLRIAVNCPAARFKFAMEMLGAMLSAPRLEPEVVDRERTALLEGFKAGRMEPMAAALDLMRQKLFARHPFGWGFAAREKSLLSLTPDDLRQFYRRVCLSADQAVIGFAGDLSGKEAHRQAERLVKACSWSDFRPAPFPAPDFPRRDIHAILSLPRQQTLVVTALPGIDIHSPDMDILSLIRADAGSMASHLFHKARDGGLVYYTGFASQPGFGFAGAMGYYGATRVERANALEKMFTAEIRRLARSGLSEEEFDHARRMKLFQLDELRQTPENLLHALTANEFNGNGWENCWRRKELLATLTWRKFQARVKRLFSGRIAVTVTVRPEEPHPKKTQ